jgi:hypothetical protein
MISEGAKKTEIGEFGAKTVREGSLRQLNK